MAQLRIQSRWGRVILALVVYVGLTRFFSAIYLAATGILTETPEIAQNPEALLDLVRREPQYLVGMIFGQAVGGVLAVLLLTLVVDRRSLGELGLGGPGPARTGSVGWGLLLGLVLASVVVLFVSAAGGRHLRPVFFAETGWQWAPMTVVAVLFAAFMEEWFVRGYLWVNLRDHYTAGRTIFLTTLVFAFLHSTNPGTTFLGWINIYLVGIVIGQLREISGGIQVPIGLHTGWNLTMGVLFGTQLSGFTFPSVLRVSLEDLPSALGGGSFGPEGSLAVTVLFGGVAVLLGRRMALASTGGGGWR